MNKKMKSTQILKHVYKVNKILPIGCGECIYVGVNVYVHQY